MKLIEDLVELIMERFRQNGYAQGKKSRFGYLRETNSAVIVSREAAKDTPIYFKKIRVALDAVRRDPSVYSDGPNRLREYGIKYINAPVWALIHLLQLQEITCERVLFESKTPIALDFDEPGDTKRIICQTYRILRDTVVSREIKRLYHSKCQICGETIVFSNGMKYAEAHHVKPLGNPHNGPDVKENIICVCPNHHVQLDYGGIKLDLSKFTTPLKHKISEEFIYYHNSIKRHYMLNLNQEEKQEILKHMKGDAGKKVN